MCVRQMCAIFLPFQHNYSITKFHLPCFENMLQNTLNELGENTFDVKLDGKITLESY